MIRILSLQKESDLQSALKSLHVDKTGIKIMVPKMIPIFIGIDSLGIPAANIVKQEMLSIGGDAALHKGASDFSVKETGCILIGTVQHYHRLIKKLAAQPFGLKRIGKEIQSILDRYFSIPPAMNLGPHRIDFANGPIIMGIVNVTPDSFSGDGISKNVDLSLKKAEQLIREGADILDIGGESTRPGASSVNLQEERERVIPTVKAIAKRFDMPISVDTSKAAIAEEAFACGAHMVNDVTGLLGDKKMTAVIKKTKAPAVVMHHQPSADVMSGISRFFEERLEFLEESGIHKESVILDPGIGFGKNSEDNLIVLKRLSELKSFGRPILIGTSRKSFIGKILNAEPKERLFGTAASLVVGRMNGARLFRVHDVKAARESLKVADAIEEAV